MCLFFVEYLRQEELVGWLGGLFALSKRLACGHRQTEGQGVKEFPCAA